jgi:LonB protease-like protein
MDRDGVALVLEHSSRLADDSGKLTLPTDRLKDLIAEADFWANEAKHEVTQRSDVQRALDETVTRMSAFGIAPRMPYCAASPLSTRPAARSARSTGLASPSSTASGSKDQHGSHAGYVRAVARWSISAKERAILVSAGTSTNALAPALDRAKSAGVAAALVDALLQDNLSLPAHIKAGLLIAARDRDLDRWNVLQIPTLLVAPNVESTSSDAQPSHFGAG